MSAELLSGRVIPFLGAGTNLCDRPVDAKFALLGPYLPSAFELADYLRSQYPAIPLGETDLARVCQYVLIDDEMGGLYDALHRVFDRDYAPSSAHRLLASIPGLLRTSKDTSGKRIDYPLIITTNYDDVMERALIDASEEFDALIYMAYGTDRGKFAHINSAGERVIVQRPNEYGGISFVHRPVLLKIHGAIDRVTPGSEGDSYVASEDDYIDYLTRTDISNLIPSTVLAKMRQSRFLFFGYGLRDWNLRVILHRVWGEQKLERKSWAIQHPVDALDQKIWDKRNVAVIDTPLGTYVEALCQALGTAC